MVNEEQIATSLGQIMGKLDSLTTQFRDYTENHDQRHTKLDTKIDERSAEIHRAQGAKGALIFVAAAVSSLISFVSVKIGRMF